MRSIHTKSRQITLGYIQLIFPHMHHHLYITTCWLFNSVNQFDQSSLNSAKTSTLTKQNKDCAQTLVICIYYSNSVTQCQILVLGQSDQWLKCKTQFYRWLCSQTTAFCLFLQGLPQQNMLHVAIQLMSIKTLYL